MSKAGNKIFRRRQNLSLKEMLFFFWLNTEQMKKIHRIFSNLEERTIFGERKYEDARTRDSIFAVSRYHSFCWLSLYLFILTDSSSSLPWSIAVRSRPFTYVRHVSFVSVVAMHGIAGKCYIEYLSFFSFTERKICHGKCLILCKVNIVRNETNDQLSKKQWKFIEKMER